MAGQFVLASQLTPDSTFKAIRVRLVRTYEISDTKKSKGVISRECIFHDQEGTLIHAHIPKEHLPKWSNFKEGDVYGIKNFLCIKNFLKFKTSPHRYMIRFKNDTLVKLYHRIVFPKQLFRLRCINSLLRKEDVDENMLIDIIGRVAEIYSPMEKVVAGKTARLIDFVLEDVKQNQIQCTVWGDHVDKFLPFLDSNTSEDLIVLLQFCKVKIFNNGEVHISSSFDATKIWINHNCPEFDLFKQSLPVELTPMRKLDSNSRLSFSRPVRSLSAESYVVTTLEEIYNRKELCEYWVAGRIVDVEGGLDWYYMACKGSTCNKKVVPRDGLLYCTKCARSWQEGCVKYKLVVRVMDSTGDAPMLMWDRECFQLLGISAASLKEKYIEASGEIPAELRTLQGMSMLFRIAMKKEQVESLQSAFVVLQVCKDPKIVETYCGKMVCYSGNAEQLGEDSFEKDELDYVPLGEDCEESSKASVSASVKRCLMDEFTQIEVPKSSLSVVIKEEKM